MLKTIGRWLVGCTLCMSAAAFGGAVEETGEVAYFELKPSIVSNLSGGPDYIRCDVQVMTRGVDRLADIEFHAAALRHEIYLLLADQDGKALLTGKGKEGLRKQILTALQGAIEEKTGEALIDDLYFTNFYVR